MKRRLNELLSISRNERTGLLFIIAIIGIIVAVKWLLPHTPSASTQDSSQAAMELMTAADTVKAEKKQKKKKNKQKKNDQDNEILTVSHLEEIKQY